MSFDVKSATGVVVSGERQTVLSSNALTVGTRVLEFEITRVIGEGGFSVVYLAFDHTLHRSIALKEYIPSALAGRLGDNTVAVRSSQYQQTFQAGLKSFINEARLLAQFDHPALVKVYRFWEGNGTAYMAMPFYEGRTLKQILKEHPEQASEVWLKHLLAPILDALELLHRHRCYHRDIAPDNIQVLANEAPVLLDFGAARRTIGDMTQAFTVILKPGYAPIEQYADEADLKQGPWTDVYALAAVLYAAIVHKAPSTSVARIVKDPLVPLAKRALSGYSAQFLSGIDRGLGVRPEDRPQSIAELRQLLGVDSEATARAPYPQLRDTHYGVYADDVAIAVGPISGPVTMAPIAGHQTAAAGLPGLDSGRTEHLRSQREPPRASVAISRSNDGSIQTQNVGAGSPSSQRPSEHGTSQRSKLAWIGAALTAILALGAAMHWLLPGPVESTHAVIATAPSEAVPLPKSMPAQDGDAAKPPTRDVPIAPPPAAAPTAIPDVPRTASPTGTLDSRSRSNFREAPQAAKASIVPGPTASVRPSKADDMSEAKAGGVRMSDASDAKDPTSAGSRDSAAVAPKTVVRINVQPFGNVYVDGKARGPSPPIIELELVAGRHVIEARNPDVSPPVVSTVIDISGTKARDIHLNFP